MKKELVLTEVVNKVGVITLNNPKALNSLNLKMIRSIYRTLEDWHKANKVRVVVIQGAGEKAFCAGGDVVSLYRAMVEEDPHAHKFFQEEYQLDLLIHSYTLPIVCFANNVVMGGGIGIMNGCSHRVVTERTTMAMPEITIGLFPDVGGSHFLNKMPQQTGLFMGLTGARFNGVDALFLAMADHFVDSAKLATLREAILEHQWSGDNGENKIFLTDLLLDFEKLSEPTKPEPQVEPRLSQINELMDFTNLHQLVKKLKKTKVEDKWMARAIQNLLKGSPTSLAVIWEQYKRGRDLSVDQAFAMELVMAKNFVKSEDFQEGIRALLIDKDAEPQWNPQKIEDVYFEDVERYFQA